MKSLFTILLFVSVITQIIYSQEPTYAGLPDSSHVLVVYNSLDQTSIDVKDYYKNARHIPEDNIVPLNELIDEWFTYGGTSHWIEIVQSGDILKDTTQAWLDRSGTAGATFHSWQYFYERIATPNKAAS